MICSDFADNGGNKLKKMKKYGGLILSLILLTGMTACADSQDTAPTPAAEAENVAEAVQETAEIAEETEEGVQSLQVTCAIQNNLGRDYEGSVLWNASYPCLYLTAEERGKFPDLEKDFRDIQNELQGEIEKFGKETKNAARQSLREARMNQEKFHPYEQNISFQLNRADSRIFSCLQKVDNVSGGVESSTWLWGRSFDTQTGAKLNLPDVFTNVSKIPQLLVEKVGKKYPDVVLSEVQDYVDSAMSRGCLPWVMGYQGATFYFGANEIASNTEKFMTVDLSFREHPDLFREDYLEVPEQYVIPFFSGQSILADLNGNGKLSAVAARLIYDEETGKIPMLEITVGSKVYSEKFTGSDFDGYLVHVGKNENYLYLDTKNDNLYGDLLIYQIRPSGVQPTGKMQDTSFRTAAYFLMGGNLLFTEPDFFMLGTRMNLLGTAGGNRCYHVGKKGMPEADPAYYELDRKGDEMREVRLVSKIPLTLSVLNTETDVWEETGDTEELPEGTSFLLERTDNATYVDAVTENQKRYRIQVKGAPSKKQSVQDVAVEECFDGIQFGS